MSIQRPKDGETAIVGRDIVTVLDTVAPLSVCKEAAVAPLVSAVVVLAVHRK